MPLQYGGSFAPALPANLAPYRALAEKAEPQAREAMLKLCTMVDVFRETPDSTLPGTPHPSGMGVMVPLEAAEVERIWDHVPWEEELKMYAGWFDAIPNDTQKPLRDAAHHLLWYGYELLRDREPLTKERVTNA